MLAFGGDCRYKTTNTPVVYDAARDRVVLFGGGPGFPNLDANDTWEWDGTKWTESKPPGPTPADPRAFITDSPISVHRFSDPVERPRHRG